MSRPELQRLQHIYAASIPIFPHPPTNLISREATWQLMCSARTSTPVPRHLTAPMPISTQPFPQFPLMRSNLVVLGQNFCTSNSPCYILDPHLHTTNLPLPDFHAKQPGNVLGQNFHARTSLSHSPMPSFIQPFPIPRDAKQPGSARPELLYLQPTVLHPRSPSPRDQSPLHFMRSNLAMYTRPELPFPHPPRYSLDPHLHTTLPSFP